MTPTEIELLWDDLEERAGRLAFWHTGTGQLQRLISTADYLRFLSHVGTGYDFAKWGSSRSQWIDTVGLLCQWTWRFEQRAGSGSFNVGSGDPAEVVKAAWAMTQAARPLHWSPKFYGSVVEQTGSSAISVSAPRHMAAAILDELVAQQAWSEPAGSLPLDIDEINEYLDTLQDNAAKQPAGQRRAYKESVFDDAEVFVWERLLRSPFLFPLNVLHPDDRIQGTPAQALFEVWHVLYAAAGAREVVAMALGFPHLHALTLSASGVAQRAWSTVGNKALPLKRYHAAVDLLTLSPSKLKRFNPSATHVDYGLHPLVEIGADEVVVPQGLVLENNIERVLLRLAAQDRRTWGAELAKRIDRSAQLADQLRQLISGELLVDSEVKMLRRDGSMAGDLDVVLIDPITRHGLVVEVAGAIIPASLHEFRDLRRKMQHKLAEQIPRLQAALADGTTTVEFPANWPKPHELRWTWAVAGPVYQGWDLADSSVFEVSAEVAELFGPYPSLAELIGTLESPPLPAHGIERVALEVLDYTITAEQVVLDSDQT